YLFEIIGKENRVVVHYNSTDLYHIGTRSIKSLQELPDVDIGVKKPAQYSFTCIDDLLKTVAAFNPREHEGIVLSCSKNNSILRLKIKPSEYITIHHLVEMSDKQN